MMKTLTGSEEICKKAQVLVGFSMYFIVGYGSEAGTKNKPMAERRQIDQNLWFPNFLSQSQLKKKRSVQTGERFEEVATDHVRWENTS